MAQRYRVNEPTIAFEEIDGEVVVINFDNGHYHALGGVATEVFVALSRGYTQAEIVEALLDRYDADESSILDSLTDFIGTLHEHALLVVDSSRRASPSEPALEAVTPRRPFSAPALESYDDMEEFLLLDPIHDVDAAGWPHVPESPRDDPPS